MFRTRLISGIILVAVALVTIRAGGPVLWVTTLIVALIGMRELYKVTGVEDKHISSLSAAAYVGAVLFHILMGLGKASYYPVVLCVDLMILMAVYVFSWPRYRSEQVMSALFGILYVEVMLSFVYQVRGMEHGRYTVWLIFISAWGCDTCAYCVGRLIGRHKMAPLLSPKKSVEGAVGGVVGAALLGVIYAALMNALAGLALPIPEYMVICAGGGLISMVGDLAASGIKRNHDVKDYGKLIPGHGGILDRFDSVIFTAPMIYLLARLLIG